MDYLYFKSENGNFGDDLNPWLWPQLIEEPADSQKTLFLGIGSILFNGNKKLHNLKDNRKIVFGTGIRPDSNYKKFRTDDSWDIRFLRGPLSAMSLSGKNQFITDAAYAIRQVEKFHEFISEEKKYKVSFMPYFKSVDYFDWKDICKQLGFNYISPYSEHGVEFTIKEIAASECLITEAMHGAIVADLLRVPWHRYVLTTPFTEGSMVSEFKWMDWLGSVDLGHVDATLIPFYRKTFLNSHIMKVSNRVLNAEFFIKSRVKQDLLKVLGSIDTYNLSTDLTISRIDEMIEEQVTLFNNDIITGND